MYINDKNFDINHADSVNEEPITITENYLGDSERDRFLRLRESLEVDDFDKREVNLKYGDKEQIKEEVIKMNKVLEHVKITGFTHCRNVKQAAMEIVGEEVGMKKSNAKKEKETIWKNPDGHQSIKEEPKQKRCMVCRKMEKGWEKKTG